MCNFKFLSNDALFKGKPRNAAPGAGGVREK
jgi:hypothetical protein